MRLWKTTIHEGRWSICRFDFFFPVGVKKKSSRTQPAAQADQMLAKGHCQDEG